MQEKERANLYVAPAVALGQVGLTYILAEVGDDLLLVDQHAAHERLMYLRLKSLGRKPPSQPLFIPITFDVNVNNLAIVESLLPVLASVGIEVEPFGGQTFQVRSVPADLDGVDMAGLIEDLLEGGEISEKPNEAEVVRDKILTRVACRSAIKGGQRLQIKEMQGLLDDLRRARLSFTCPHGRPTMILLSKGELDRQFKRKL